MRIGIYDPYLDDLGGGEKYMMTIASCLSKTHDVDVFWDDKADLSALTTRFGLDMSSVSLVKDIFSPSMPRIKRLWITRRYDAIIFLSDGSVPFVFSKKLLLHIQQPLDTISVNSLIGRLKFSRVKKVFCNSEFTKSYVERKLPCKIEVIYPPVTLYPKHVKKENIILHVGRFRVKNVKIGDYKKQSIMIEAFKEMVDHGLTNWEFVLAVSLKENDKATFEEMKQKASGYPIRFEINKTNVDLWELYNKAKIYWHASGYGEDLQKHPEFAEHFGISTVEAMGAGAVPVVVNAGGQKEIVTDGVNGLLWDTLHQLQEKTKELTEDAKLLQQLSEKARIRAEQFNTENFCKRIQELVM